MSIKRFSTKLPPYLTPDLLSLVEALHSSYGKTTGCNCSIRIGTERDTYHHGSSNAIYLGTDVIKGWMKKCQLDRTAALMFTYVLAHEYGHAIFERPNADVRSIMALYFMGYLTLKGQKRMTRDTHRSLNLPIPAEMVDYLSGQPEFVRREQRSFLRLLPRELREPNLTNLSAGEFLAEMNAAVLLQNLDLRWDHPLSKQVVGAVQEADWYRTIAPRHGQRMLDLVSFLRWNVGLQTEPAALQHFRHLFPPEFIARMLPKDKLDKASQPANHPKILVEFSKYKRPGQNSAQHKYKRCVT
jgi:hypothetical protein